MENYYSKPTQIEKSPPKIPPVKVVRK